MVAAAVNLGEILDDAVAAVPDRVALHFADTDQAVTYGELGAAVDSVAEGLRAAGVQPGDRVAVVDEASELLLAAVLGAARIGAAAAPMNHRLTSEEIAALHREAGCSPVVVAGPSQAAAVESALGHPPLGPSDLLPRRRVSATLRQAHPDTHTGTALVLFTSGTTGLPKAVPMAHADLVPRVTLFGGTLDADRPADHVLVCVPLVHVGGLVGVLVALNSGATNVVQRTFDAGEWLRLIEHHRIQRTFLVPTMLRRIVDHPDFGAADLSSLQSIAYGAAPASPELIARAREAFPDVLFSNVFGQTETLGAITVLFPDDHANPARAGSVGRPMPGVELRVVDPDSGDDVPTGELGEVWVRQGGEWHRTGDLVRQDGDGYLFPEGRLSDTINRGGEKIGPPEVEAVLARHPAVADVAVAAVPDPDLGQCIGAAVVAREPVDTDDLRAWCRQHLAPFKVPDAVAVVDEIPLTDVGKVDRRAVAKLVAERVAERRAPRP